MRRALGGAVLGLTVVFGIGGCPSSHDTGDAGTDAATIADTGASDAPSVDAGAPVDAPVPTDATMSEPCTMPGAVEMQACGHCGTLSRFCTTDHVWSYGPCTGETGVCEPGTSGLTTCGRCGQQAQFCDDSCAWVPMGACLNETGACVPGSQTSSSMGCPAGQIRDRICDATCSYVDGPCATGECTAGQTMMASCGRCGHMTRTCDATGHWMDGACTGEGPCMPGATMTATCQVCGTQTNTCSATCAWTPGACTGGVTCAPRPMATCTSPTVLHTYDPTPACVAGACAYTARDVTCTAGCTAGACVGGATLIDGLGGTTGYGPNLLAVGDDSATTAISLSTLAPTGLLYYGTRYTTLFQGTNGYVTFGAASMHFNQPIGAPGIAGLFGDVDTRGGGQPTRNSVVWYADGTRFIGTWLLVGRYAMDDSLQNSFQIIITPRPTRADGDFDVELRFAQCAWSTTSTGTVYSGFEGGAMPMWLPGSGTPAVLDLCTTSNASSVGVWRYEVRGGIPMVP